MAHLRHRKDYLGQGIDNSRHSTLDVTPNFPPRNRYGFNEMVMVVAPRIPQHEPAFSKGEELTNKLYQLQLDEESQTADSSTSHNCNRSFHRGELTEIDSNDTDSTSPPPRPPAPVDLQNRRSSQSQDDESSSHSIPSSTRCDEFEWYDRNRPPFHYPTPPPPYSEFHGPPHHSKPPPPWAFREDDHRRKHGKDACHVIHHGGHHGPRPHHCERCAPPQHHHQHRGPPPHHHGFHGPPPPPPYYYGHYGPPPPPLPPPHHFGHHGPLSHHFGHHGPPPPPPHHFGRHGPPPPRHHGHHGHHPRPVEWEYPRSRGHDDFGRPYDGQKEDSRRHQGHRFRQWDEKNNEKSWGDGGHAE